MTGAGATRPPMDNPIRSSAQDALRRGPVAHAFARSVRALDASEGAVVAVLGAWGDGKSSFVNLMCEQFGESPALVVVEFNPWMLSGTQQLVDFFFTEIASGLQIKNGDKFDAAVKVLREYGDVLSPLGAIPVFGSWWDRTFKATQVFTEWLRSRRQKNAGALHDRVAATLGALDAPIVVVIDDIDRLTTPEIREIFRLVRLTASFPNLIYVLAFDRVRVEAALDEDGVPGRAYLEKIVQLGFDLPSIPRTLLREEILSEINRVVGDVDDDRFDHSRWPDIYFEVIEPLVANLRDVSRLTLSARPVIADLGAQVEVVDLLAMESIRVLRPELFEALRRLRHDLTAVASRGFGQSKDSGAQTRMDELLQLAGIDEDIVRSLITRVFPAAEQYTGNRHWGPDWLGAWRKAHRMAHEDFLSLYLDRVAPTGIEAYSNAERAFALLYDGAALRAFLTSLNPEILGDSIAALEAFEGEYPTDGIVPGATALLNAIPDIPQREEGLATLRRELTVTRVVLRMLRGIADEAEREAAVRAILQGVETYSSKFELTLLVGHVEHAGANLVSEGAAADLEQQLVREVTVAPPANISREWDLLRAYWFVKSRGGDIDLGDVTDTELIRRLLGSAVSQTRAQSLESRHVRRTDVLAWETLVDVFGSEDALRDAVATLRAVDGGTDLVLLAERYLGGWRPKGFGA